MSNRASYCKFALFALTFFLGLTSSDTAWAYTDAQIRDMVQGRLLDRHPNDTPQWWRSLGDNSVPVIIGMYTSENNTFHRVRLLQGLGWMDDPQAVDFVKQQAQQTDLDPIKNAAIRAIGKGQGAKESDFLAKFLKDENPQTRLAAAESLKQIADSTRNARARDLYDSYLKEEKTPWLLDRLNGKTGITGALKPVSSSEDRISPEFEGTWRGYWVAPKTGVKGMQSAPVVLQLKTPSNSADITAIGGTLMVVNRGKAARSFDLGGASGKGIQLAGNLVQSGLRSRLAPTKLAFRGGLTRVGETVFLEIRVPEKTSVLLLKKD